MLNHGGEMQSRNHLLVILVALLGMGFTHKVQATCKNPAPPASAFANPGHGSCPSAYYSSGNACAPTSSAKYAFVNPGGGSCPSTYYSSGIACVASSNTSCNAFFSGGGACPSGYYSSGKSCVSN